jgi:hypothetical protein
MGLFGGPRREPVEAEDRQLVMPPIWNTTQGDYASLNPAHSGTAMQSVAVRATVDLIASLGSERSTRRARRSPPRRTSSTRPATARVSRTGCTGC